MQEMKNWLYWAIKAFVNDYSIGLSLIVIGFILGWCSQVVWSIICKVLHYVQFY
jgi:hypothetical protein